MAQHEPVDPLSEVDALLTQELSVTPSPEFLPRVRERIRLEPAPSRWPRLLILGPMAAAATLVLAAGLTYWITATTSPVAPTPPSLTIAAVNPHANVPEPRVPSPESRVPSPESRVPNPESRVPNPEYRVPYPEVIVDERQKVALFSLLRLINQGQLTEESFKSTTPPPTEIGVEPVAVSPIVVGGVLPGETERK